MLADLTPAHIEAGPTEIDVSIGRKLRRRRRILGLTQAEVANAIGVQHQQIQKYECAATRMSAARLYELSRALDVPVNYFYEGLSLRGVGTSAISSSAQSRSHEDLAKSQVLELIRASSKIPDRARLTLLEFARSLEESVAAEDICSQERCQT